MPVGRLIEINKQTNVYISYSRFEKTNVLKCINTRALSKIKLMKKYAILPNGDL